MARFFFIFHALSFELNLFFDWRFPLSLNKMPNWALSRYGKLGQQEQVEKHYRITSSPSSQILLAPTDLHDKV